MNAVTHAYVSATADDPDAEINKTRWNQGHTLALALSALGIKGTDIVCAATLVPADDGEFHDVTGATGPVTAITPSPAWAAGRPLILRFTGAPTINHNGTSLILRGAANVVLAAGDILIFRSLGAGNWVEINRLSPGGLAALISAATVSAQGAMPAADKQMHTRQTVTGGTVTINWSLGTRYELTSNANIAITMSNGIVGETHVVVLKYGGAHTVTWTTTVVWDNATTPTWQSANTKVDLVILYWDGTTWRGGLGGKFAS